MKKLRIKCNGKQGTCNNFIMGEFYNFNELAESKDWQAVGKGWVCTECQKEQNSKREKKTIFNKKESIIEEKED